MPSSGSYAATFDAAAGSEGTTLEDRIVPLPLHSTLPDDASPHFRAVADALMESMRTHRIPGAALGILAGDQEEHATFGVASMNTLVPVGPDTMFQTGSLTKTYTATAIWGLIDNGKLALDAPVRRYIPDLRLQDEATAAAVTVDNLLTHTAGWYGDEGIYTGEDDHGIARYVAERLPQLPQEYPLGKFFSYNNSCFTILGHLIEVATGTTYNAAMQNLVLGPLGLTNTLLDHAALLQRPYSDGHYAGPINGNDRIAVQTPLWLPHSVDPAGGLWSTTRDVLRYARFHLVPGEIGEPTNIVSPESRRRMQEPAKDLPAFGLRIGRNWFLQEIGGVRVFMHNGDTLGQHTVFVAVPEQAFALVLFVNNLGGGSAAEVEVLKTALGNYPGLRELAGKVGMTQSSLVPPNAPAVALTSTQLTEYAGRYANPAMAFTFVATDAGLEGMAEVMEPPSAYQSAIDPPLPSGAGLVAFLEKDMAVSSGTRLPFIRDDSGHVGWLFSGYRLLPRTAAS